VNGWYYESLDDTLVVCQCLALSVFFAPVNKRVYKISRSQFQGGFMSNEHKSLPWSRPLLRGNSPTSSGLILMETSVAKGEYSA
jgi:hypothetical protein